MDALTWKLKVLLCLMTIVVVSGCGSKPPASATDATYTGPAILEPNHSLTPGRLCTQSDPDFQEMRYDPPIPYCQRNVSEAEKAQVAATYGVSKALWSQYEFDHLIPLSIGGSDGPENIWPQRLDAAHEKDKLEDQLFQELRSGQISQKEAVDQIMAWHMP